MALSPFPFVSGAGVVAVEFAVVVTVCSATVLVADAVSTGAGLLATGVTTLGADVPAGLKYCPYFSRSYASPSTDFSNNSLIIFTSASVGSLGLKSPRLCKPNFSTALLSASSSALSLLYHFDVE